MSAESQTPPQEQNIAHPLAEIAVTEADKAAIDMAMQQVNEHREALADQKPSEVFSGLLPDGDGNRLLVIDRNEALQDSRPYVVRTARVSDLADGNTLQEEYVSRDNATANRDTKQVLSTSLLGSILAGQGRPATLLEERREDRMGLVGFAQLQNPDGSSVDAVALADAFAEITDQDQQELARRQLDVEAHRGEYPEITDRGAEIVEFAVRPYAEALGSDQLNEADRRRLVSMGQRVMKIANDNPDNVDHFTVLDPVKAEVMARAADPVLSEPAGGVFGRRRRLDERKQRAHRVAHAAALEYEESLHQPAR